MTRLRILLVVMSCVLLMLAVHAKDIYVAAGAGAGDGSQEAPYGDVAKAVSRAKDNDVIHVSQGVYLVGALYINQQNLRMLGGYSAGFEKRDPWKYPTVLMRPVDAEWNAAACKAAGCTHPLTPGADLYSPGPIISEPSRSEADCFTLDGFVIDGHTRQKFLDNGQMDMAVGPVSPLIDLPAGSSTIKYCLILNGYTGIRVNGDFRNTIADCYIVNVVNRAIDNQGKVLKVTGTTMALIWTAGKTEGFGVHLGRGSTVELETSTIGLTAGAGMNSHAQPGVMTLKNNSFFNGTTPFQFFNADENAVFAIESTKINGTTRGNISEAFGNKAVAMPAGFIDAAGVERFTGCKGVLDGGGIPLLRWDKVLPALTGAPAAGGGQAGPADGDQATPAGDGEVKPPAGNPDKTYKDIKFSDLLGRANQTLVGKDVRFTSAGICPGNSNSYLKMQGISSDDYVTFEIYKDETRSLKLYLYVRAGSNAEKVLSNLAAEDSVTLCGKVYTMLHVPGSMVAKVAVVIEAVQ